MDYSKTNIEFLEDDLLNEYGKTEGTEIYQTACQKYGELCTKEQKFDNEVMNDHLFHKILPAIALYFTFREKGHTKEDAVKLVLNKTQKNARRMKESNQTLGKMPFGYFLFKTFVKTHMTKNYPRDGWDMDWVCKNQKEVHFDMKRCIYSETCHKYDCPELCTIFCQNDTTAFQGYLPNIEFERTGTIGEGSEKCDFHYLNAAKRSKKK